MCTCSTEVVNFWASLLSYRTYLAQADALGSRDLLNQAQCSVSQPEVK